MFSDVQHVMSWVSAFSAFSPTSGAASSLNKTDASSRSLFSACSVQKSHTNNSSMPAMDSFARGVARVERNSLIPNIPSVKTLPQRLQGTSARHSIEGIKKATSVMQYPDTGQLVVPNDKFGLIPRPPSCDYNQSSKTSSFNLLSSRLRLFQQAWEYFAHLHDEEGRDDFVLKLTLADDIIWQAKSSDIRTHKQKLQHAPEELFLDNVEKHNHHLVSSKAFKKALKHVTSKNQHSEETLISVRRELDSHVDGTIYKSLLREKNSAKTEAQLCKHRLNELVRLSERIGAQLRTSEEKSDKAVVTLKCFQKKIETERVSHREALKLNKTLLTSLDESNRLLEQKDQRVQFLTKVLDKSREKNRILEGERTILTKNCEQSTFLLMSEFYEKFKILEVEDVDEEENTNLKMGIRPYLRGMGYSSSVPVFLKCSGRVRNLCLSKGIVERIVQEVWVSRYILSVSHQELPEVGRDLNVGGKAAAVALQAATRDQKYDANDYGHIVHRDLHGERFHSFFNSYLEERWENKLEWAYSIVDALERFAYDADLELFSEVLKGNLPEEVFLDQHVMIHKFKSQLNVTDDPTAEEAEEDDSPTHRYSDVDKKKNPDIDLLSVGVIEQEVRKYFGNKSEEVIKSLGVCLRRDTAFLLKENEDLITESTLVAWLDLFKEDKEGNQMSFIEAIRDQHLEEVATYMTQLQDSIESVSKDGKCCMRDLRREVLTLDPSKPSEDIDQWINIITDNPPSQKIKKWDKQYDTSLLLMGAKSVLQRRYGPCRLK